MAARPRLRRNKTEATEARFARVRRATALEAEVEVEAVVEVEVVVEVKLREFGGVSGSGSGD